MKNKNINMLIVALIMAGLMAFMLAVFIEDTHDKFQEKITVDADGVTETTLEVRDLALIPTQKSEYSVNLVCAASGGYFVYLDFTEEKDGGMKPFVVVTVSCDGKQVYSGRLNELLDSDYIIEFEAELEAKEPRVISFKYEMPYETGNEAQGTYADFNIKLTIKKN
jgi:hypothetical protein